MPGKKNKKSSPRSSRKTAERPKKATKKVARRKVASKRRIVRKPRAQKKKLRPLDLEKSHKNPIMSPASGSYWESEAVFNPGAVMHGGRVHLFYRALGPDGISRVGYASSKDGVHFDIRHPHPVYMPEMKQDPRSSKHAPYTSPARLAYDRTLYASGGGWGGCEDPRAVKIDGRVYITFNMFNGWDSIRVGVTSISEEDLERGVWRWKGVNYLSSANERQKNWVLFPEKMDGKFAILHSVSPDVKVDYVEDFEDLHVGKKRIISSRAEERSYPHYVWESWIRSASAPPVKTKYGWLLFYHGMDKNDPNRYKLGVMLLDSNDPSKVLYRSTYPILEPDEWYENDWKPGIIYASGALVKGNNLYIYYGGGDKHIGVAYTNLDDFISKLRKKEHITFSKNKVTV